MLLLLPSTGHAVDRSPRRCVPLLLKPLVVVLLFLALAYQFYLLLFISTRFLRIRGRRAVMLGSADTLTTPGGLLLLSGGKNWLRHLVRTLGCIRRVQNLVEVLKRVHVQFNYVCRLVVGAHGAVLKVLPSGSSIVCLRLPHCSLPGLRGLTYALEALLSAASQARQHLILICGH